MTTSLLVGLALLMNQLPPGQGPVTTAGPCTYPAPTQGTGYPTLPGQSRMDGAFTPVRWNSTLGPAGNNDGPGNPEATGKPDQDKPENGKSENGNGDKEPKSGEGPFVQSLKPNPAATGFCARFYKAYYDEFYGTAPVAEEPEPPRRTLPSPWTSPPFPNTEYQGYPLVGVPGETTYYPLMKAILGADTDFTNWLKDSKINFYGWATVSGNYSTNHTNDVNAPMSYWVVANHFELDQLVFRLERNLDSVQQDHIDVGFRVSLLYGMDYRYMAATGWGSDVELQEHNLLYGWDPTEAYFDIYFPGITEGMILRVGRWIACPDIEVQFAPDNYMGSHSILFTFDTYTQTGLMASFLLSKRFEFQIGINAGDDQAPWAHGAVDDPSLFVGMRWVSESNNDAVYGCLNQFNDARFHHYTEQGVPSGHDNYNYYVATWEHRFNVDLLTKTEAYFMWQDNAELGGTPVIGPYKYGTGGGDNPTLPGASHAYGILNFTEVALSKNDLLSIRNEVWEDDRGMRSGYAGLYTSHALGISHNFNSVLQVRPEIGYYRNYETPAFDDGTRKGCWIYGFDATLRF